MKINLETSSKNLPFWFALTLIALIQSCSQARFVPKGDYLYTKADVKVVSDTIPNQYIQPLEEALEELLRPKPNDQFLGLMPKLFVYNLIDSPKKENSIKGWLKYKVGAPPVYLSDVNLEYNQNLLRNRLENLGFFQAEVTADTTIHKHKASIQYTATPGIIYRIKSISYDLDSNALGRDILATKPESLLQTGKGFNLSTIISERERIDNVLKNKGYYYFSPDYLLIEVDSTSNDHQVELYVTLKAETPVQAKQKFFINNIYLYPNYVTGQSLQGRNHIRNAETYRNDYHFIDPEHTFRQFALARIMFFQKGDSYNRLSHSLTLNQLVNMGTFKFVKNEFKNVDSANNLLDVYYYLTPMPKRGLRIELLAKTASIYDGSEITVNWLNRNIFKSGELLTITAFGGFETQRGGGVRLNSSYNRYGLEAALSFPRLIAPFSWEPTRRFVPRTIVRAGYEFLNRKSAYTLNSLRFSYDYNWKEDIQKEHDVSLLEINYVQARNVSDAFKLEVQNNPTLAHTIAPQFTFGPNYSFTFTNTMQAERQHTYYFKTGLDLSANTYGLIRGASFSKDKVYKLFNSEFSQYVKVEGDFRHYVKLGQNQVIASRIIAGMGYSYGNSRSLPYFKQFFSGGPNSLKGFTARSVGPGSYSVPAIIENNYFIDQTGDIKLELNSEFRTKLFSIIHGAIFLDAGNIWLQRKDANKPNAEFGKDFYKELAVSGGFGFRFDLSFLILRTDLGMPFRIPSLAEGNRWVFNKIDLTNSTWRRDNMIFNLSIGYPF